MEIAIAVDGAAPLALRLEGTRERRIWIGRSKRCEVRLADPKVAELHAELVLGAETSWLCAREPLLLGGQQVLGWCALPREAELRIGASSVRLARGRAAAGGPVPAPRPPANLPAEERYAALAKRFALPPEELEAVPEAPPPPFLKQRFLNLSSFAWIALAAGLVVAVVAFTTRRVPVAEASRALPVIPGPAPRQPTPLRARAGKAEAAKVRAAAEALFNRDDARALRLYRELASVDPRFLPFFRALELRGRGP